MHPIMWKLFAGNYDCEEDDKLLKLLDELLLLVLMLLDELLLLVEILDSDSDCDELLVEILDDEELLEELLLLSSSSDRANK